MQESRLPLVTSKKTGLFVQSAEMMKSITKIQEQAMDCITVIFADYQGMKESLIIISKSESAY